MKLSFSEARPLMDEASGSPKWIMESGEDLEALKARIAQIESACPSGAMAKAKSFLELVTHARIALEPGSPFPYRMDGQGILATQRWRWEQRIVKERMPEWKERIDASSSCAAYTAQSDFGHLSPNTRLLLSVGIDGLAERLKQIDPQS